MTFRRRLLCWSWDKTPCLALENTETVEIERLSREMRQGDRCMEKKELGISGGRLSYEIAGNRAVITGFQGAASELLLPGQIEGWPVAAIGKKAFLSKKALRRLILPETVEEVGDWAFAYCDGLAQVILPEKFIRFGKAVFLECGSLRHLSGKNGKIPGELLAAAIRDLDAYYLLDLTEAGSEEWLKKWDARLVSALRAPDREGYSKQVLCGEEDYGSTDLEGYLSARRKYKIRLALLRCMFSQGLSEELRAELISYLLAHTKGRSSQETWQVVLEEHGNDREYYSLFTALGCLDSDNLDSILSDIGEDYPEMKAHILRYAQEHWGERNFFSGLEL